MHTIHNSNYLLKQPHHVRIPLEQITPDEGYNTVVKGTAELYPYIYM